MDPNEEIDVLAHEAVPGYRKVFYIVFGVIALYLLVIILSFI